MLSVLIGVKNANEEDTGIKFGGDCDKWVYNGKQMSFAYGSGPAKVRSYPLQLFFGLLEVQHDNFYCNNTDTVMNRVPFGSAHPLIRNIATANQLTFKPESVNAEYVMVSVDLSARVIKVVDEDDNDIISTAFRFE